MSHVDLVFTDVSGLAFGSTSETIYNSITVKARKTRTLIDLDKLYALAQLMWPGGGGGKEIVRLIEQVKAGKLPGVNNGK
jgi:hypothetical protein